MPEINKHYIVKEGIETYPRRAMVKALIWTIELGFNIGPDDKVMVPDHETLRHFEKVRMDNKGMDAIMMENITAIIRKRWLIQQKRIWKRPGSMVVIMAKRILIFM